jgi:hypothetical protein
MSATELQLSEEARQRIRAEEIYREEVRREIGGAPRVQSSVSKVLGALNKPLALWFLSSVVLGLIGWAYAQWEEDRAVRAQNRAEIVKLDIEMYGRLQRCSARLAFARDSLGLREAIEMLDEGSGVFPALDNRSFAGLLLALNWLVPEEEKTDIASARDDYHKLRQFRNTPQEDAAETIARVKRDFLDKSFAIRKWRD